MVSGCTKKSATPTPTTGNQNTATPSQPGTATSPNNQTSQPGTATQPSKTNNPSGTTKTPGGTVSNKPLPEITFKQFTDVKMGGTLDETNKALGAQGTLTSDKAGKQTYEYKVKDVANSYANLVFAGGKLSEKSTYKK